MIETKRIALAVVVVAMLFAAAISALQWVQDDFELNRVITTTFIFTSVWFVGMSVLRLRRPKK